MASQRPLASRRSRLFEAIPAPEVYAVNGLQVQDFNTVFQLMADARDGSLPTTADLGSRTMLLLPDLIASWLTGSMYAEVTNASTTGLVDARTRSWSEPRPPPPPTASST